MNGLKKQVVAFAGTFENPSKYDLELTVKDHGGRATGSPGKTLTLMVTGEDPKPSMLNKAKKFDARIMTLDEFWEICSKELLTFGVEPGLGELEPGDLTQALERKCWRRYDPVFGDRLIAELAHHEEKYGVGKPHFFVSKQLFDNPNRGLEARHPFHHTAPVTSYAVSEDGRWLATASYENVEYRDVKTYHREGTSVIQVWDVERRTVHTQRDASATVGTTSEGGLFWSPNGQHLAAMFNVNSVGIYDPFGRWPGPYVSATIPEPLYPIHVRWAQNGQHLFLSREENDSKGWWVFVEGRLPSRTQRGPMRGRDERLPAREGSANEYDLYTPRAWNRRPEEVSIECGETTITIAHDTLTFRNPDDLTSYGFDFSPSKNPEIERKILQHFRFTTWVRGTLNSEYIEGYLDQTGRVVDDGWAAAVVLLDYQTPWPLRWVKPRKSRTFEAAAKTRLLSL